MEFSHFVTRGPDVSFYQDAPTTPQQIDFSKMVEQGAEFVIIRAGQNQWIDPDWEYNWTHAKEAGLPRGAYWFYDSRYDPIRQAELCASLLGNDPPELRMWLDLEENYNGSYAGYTNWKKFINRFKQLLPNVSIGIYTGYYYIVGKIPVAEYEYFRQFQLWLAWYTSNPDNVRIPAPWTVVEFWQEGTPPWGIAWGCESTEIDMNRYNGSKEDLLRNFGLSGETMQYKVVWSAGVARRTAPTTTNSSTNLTPYPFDSVVDVVQDNIPDQSAPTDPNKKWVKFTDGMYGASNYPDGSGPQVRMVKLEDPNPPTSLPTIHISYRADGYPDLDIDWEPNA